MDTQTGSLRGWWGGLGRAARIGFSLGVLLILVLLAGAAYWTLRPREVPLFTDMAPHDSAAVMAQLEGMGEPYQVDEETGRILVDEARRDDVRAALVERGLTLKGPVGFELFDNSDFGMTEFSQRINYQRGLEGELTRTIMALDGVEHARLHLVMPDSSLFKRDREPPKAAVTLITSPSKSLTPGQIEGIRSLIAASVPDLKPEMVSIHDQRGVDLGNGSTGSGAEGLRIAAKREFEAYLADKMRGLLRPLFVDRKVEISIDARLRMDRISATRDDILASGRLQQQVEELPGAVEKLSIAVLVPAPLPAGLTSEALVELLSRAAGIDSERGDRLVLHSVVLPAALPSVPATAEAAFDPDLDQQAPESQKKAPQWLWLLGAGAFAGMLLLLVTLLVRTQHGNDTPRLSSEEREALLLKVREWVREDMRRTGA